MTLTKQNRNCYNCKYKLCQNKNFGTQWMHSDFVCRNWIRKNRYRKQLEGCYV